MTPAAPALLVPMIVEGLVVTVGSRAGSWSYTPPRYGFLPWHESTDPAPFTPQVPLPGRPDFTGVILHWSLPDGLTRGGPAGQDGTVAYPSIPNRWLVVRRHRDPADPRRWAYRCVVIAADQPGDETGAPWPGPGGDREIRVGRWWPLDAFPGEERLPPAAVDGPWTAVGPGDATFAAFAPNVPNVLSFADPLADVTAGPLTYSVYGWYADPRDDPMDDWQTVAQWTELTARLGWSVPEPDRAVAAARRWAQDHGRTVSPSAPRTLYPARTLCHGTLAGVAWLGPDGPPFTGVPTTNPHRAGYRRPHIAVGNTAADATMALLGGDPVLAEVLRPGEDAWFNTGPGGTGWTVVTAEAPDEPSGRQAPAALSTAQAATLTALNTAQRGLDESTARLGGLRSELDALRWKLEYLTRHPALRDRWEDQVLDATRRTEARTVEATGACRWWSDRRDTALAALRDALGDLVLKPVDGAPQLRPNDPVVVIAGAGRAFKHGDDGLTADDGTLVCRFTGQTYAAIDVGTGAGDVRVGGGDLPVPPVSAGWLPPELPDLAVEAVLLDLASAPVIAAHADPADPWPLLEQIRRSQTVIWNAVLHPALPAAVVEDAEGLVTAYGLGAVPAAAAYQPWAPPWSPLYLDWKVRYHPGAALADGALRDWTPPGDGDGARYTWRGGDPRTPGITLSGRTLLTPQPGAVLAGALDRLAGGVDPQAAADPAGDTDPALTALRDLAHDLRRADLLCQSLSGLGQALLQRSPGTVRATTVVAGQAWAPDSRPLADALARQFAPLRAGHLTVVDLRVVDDFGQVFRIMDASPAPIVFDADLTSPVPGLAVLRPRVTQDARLELSLLDAGDDSEEVGVDTAADPVCGYLLCQPLDRAVAVYDPDGAPLGQLTAARGGAWWWPAPGGGTDVDGIPNRHLRALVEGVLAHPDLDGALRALLELMADASYREAGETWSDEEMPLPIGQPIAVARAALRWRLPGGPATAQRWADTGRDTTGGFEHARLPVWLGGAGLPADGVVGWYSGDDYGRISSPFAPDRPAPGSYVGRAPARPALDDPAGVPVTVLVAPHAAIHAVSGVVPPVAVTLPAPLVAPALRRMAVTVRTGPVLDDGAGPTLPLAAIAGGAWSWLQHPRPGHGTIEHQIEPADDTAHLPDAPPVAREGWLRRRPGGPATRFTYTVTPRALACTVEESRPSTAMLRLVVANDTGTDVRCTGLTFALPVGHGEDDLTGDPEPLAATVDEDWHVETDGTGRFHATPRTAAPVPAGRTITVAVRGVLVNAVPGTCVIEVTEDTDATRTTDLVVSTLDTLPV
ncbi:hypothetical protein ACFPIJ_09705 [Dactylosporangium cerinum]|uniref:Uncharacterized protein n=1 Tax=Dactylosporangium cerinum TaxID=1434730 RepID=A0ABV9VR53_9ACTN